MGMVRRLKIQSQEASNWVVDGIWKYQGIAECFLLCRFNQIVLVYETKLFFISNRTLNWEGLGNWLGEVQSLKSVATKPSCSLEVDQNTVGFRVRQQPADSKLSWSSTSLGLSITHNWREAWYSLWHTWLWSSSCRSWSYLGQWFSTLAVHQSHLRIFINPHGPANLQTH